MNSVRFQVKNGNTRRREKQRHSLIKFTNKQKCWHVQKMNKRKEKRKQGKSLIGKSEETKWHKERLEMLVT